MKVNVRKKIKIFISYSWDNQSHKVWVKKLYDNLKNSNFDVIFDQEHLKPGMNKNLFMENSIKKANKVLLILTPNYAKKADKRRGGVGHEYSIINEEVSNSINQFVKYVPILRAGDAKKSCPSFLQALVHFDMRDNKLYELNCKELISELRVKRKTRIEFGEDDTEKAIALKIKSRKKNGRKSKNTKDKKLNTRK